MTILGYSRILALGEKQRVINMEPEAKYILVGVTVIALTIALIVSILWVTRSAVGEKQKYYVVYFKEQSLEGLQKDSNVTMKGIKVGNVDRFNIFPKDIEQVKVILSLAENTPVKVDTKAVIKRNLLTGLATIDLVGSSQGSDLLHEVREDEEGPIIAEGKTKLEEIAATVPDLLDQTNNLLSAARQFFSEENSQALKNTLIHVEEVSGALAAQRTEISTLVKDLQELVRRLNKLSRSVEPFAAKLDQRSTAVADELQQTLTKLRELAEGLTEQSKALSSSAQVTADSLALQLQRLSEGINRTTNAVATAAEKLEQPRDIIFGPQEKALGPGEHVRP